MIESADEVLVRMCFTQFIVLVYSYFGQVSSLQLTRFLCWMVSTLRDVPRLHRLTKEHYDVRFIAWRNVVSREVLLLSATGS